MRVEKHQEFENSQNEIFVAFKNVLLEFPELPKTVQYHDEFDNVLRVINDFDITDNLEIKINGTEQTLYFLEENEEFSFFYKNFFLYLCNRNLYISTVYSYTSALMEIEQTYLAEVLTAEVTSAKSLWFRLLASDLESDQYNALKHVLKLLSLYNINSWSEDRLPFVSSLPLKKVDKYSVIKRKKEFLSVADQACIVKHFDKVSESIGTKNLLARDIQSAGILVCCFQLGLRPIQIASLRMEDVAIWTIVDEKSPPIHLTCKMVKQRSKSKAIAFQRKITNQWSRIFVEQFRNRTLAGATPNQRFFDIDSSLEMSFRIIEISRRLLKKRKSAYDYRHSAAQRLVDSGATQEDLATFLGHTDKNTCLVYFENAPNHVQVINDALGLSPIFKKVAEIGRLKFISKEELSELKKEQQVAGIPHGFQIAGIGACASGQPNCPYNPVTSCYGCHKFQPTSDLKIHESVLQDFREVVNTFRKTNEHIKPSQTTSQLKQTILNIQNVIAALEDNQDA